ncbi:MAG: hypothetical protein ACI8ZM_004751 [Crocinitomix sp.]|jgi:hypothetical protein
MLYCDLPETNSSPHQGFKINPFIERYLHPIPRSMKLLTLVLFFLIQPDAMGQFYGHIKASPTAEYTSDHRYAHGQRLTQIMFDLSQIAKLTNSKISYKYADLGTFNARSKRTSVDQNRERTVEKQTYTDSLCSYMKAVFTDGLNATYEAWFNHYHSSDSIRIVFDSKDQYLKQIEEIEASKNYLRLSSDSLVLTNGEFWKKPKHKKLFGKEFMTLDPENMEINVVARYYRKKDYKALQKRL